MLSPLFVPADIMGSSLLVFFKNLAKGFAWLGGTLGVGWFDLGFLTAVIGQIIYTNRKSYRPMHWVVGIVTMVRRPSFAGLFW